MRLVCLRHLFLLVFLRDLVLFLDITNSEIDYFLWVAFIQKSFLDLLKPVSLVQLVLYISYSFLLEAYDLGSFMLLCFFFRDTDAPLFMQYILYMFNNFALNRKFHIFRLTISLIPCSFIETP